MQNEVAAKTNAGMVRVANPIHPTPVFLIGWKAPLAEQAPISATATSATQIGFRVRRRNK